MTSAAAAQTITVASTGTQAAPCTAPGTASEVTGSYGHHSRYSVGEEEYWDVPHQTLRLIFRQLFAMCKRFRNAHAFDSQSAGRGAVAGQCGVEMAETDF